jgi:sulfur-carrier protein adenylyltransferase/sulfurtransferase
MNDSNKIANSEILTTKELRRYELQINNPLIGIKGQEKIKQSKVLIIGTGSKGTCILQYLSALGVGKLGICDNSIVEENELSRQFLFGNSDLGKQKAITSKQKLNEINHLVQYELHNVLLNEQNINSIISNYDILVDSTENFDTHYLIDEAAIKNDIPYIFFNITGDVVSITVLNYQRGPTLKLLFPVKPEDKSNSKHEFLSQVSLTGIIGAIISTEVVKIIFGLQTQLNGNLMNFYPNDYQISFTKII